MAVASCDAGYDGRATALSVMAGLGCHAERCWRSVCGRLRLALFDRWIPVSEQVPAKMPARGRERIDYNIRRSSVPIAASGRPASRCAFANAVLYSRA